MLKALLHHLLRYRTVAGQPPDFGSGERVILSPGIDGL